jgi:tetratricopeptide (TPR) repeat protein
VQRVRLIFYLWTIVLCSAAFFCAPVRADKLTLPPEALAAADQIYSGDFEGGRLAALRLQDEQPEHPIGYLLEAEALWWKIWCTSAEFKYGMNYPRHRAKLSSDRHYFELAAKVSSRAEKKIAERDSAEMEFYAGMGDALAARLYGLRGEGRNTAHAGVRAREHLLRAVAKNPELADADFGLGLYNYYIDTLSAAARFLRFFMGIPGGSKKEGIRQLQRAIEVGVLVPPEARFYLAINLHNYDQQYERALEVIGPLVEKYPSNPLFQLARGDLFAKLGRTERARECYLAASAAVMNDAECQHRVQELVRASLAAMRDGKNSDRNDARSDVVH